MFVCVVIKVHDDQSEGLTRGAILSLIVKASGGKLTRKQAARTWDKTIHPFGKKIGLLTGYVKPQEGTSKRTAAGDLDLQQKWHDLCDELFRKIKKKAKELLRDDDLVEEMMPWLIVNLDEECLHALGKNHMIVGSKSKKKHDNQNASSRYLVTVFVFVFVGRAVCLD